MRQRVELQMDVTNVSLIVIVRIINGSYFNRSYLLLLCGPEPNDRWTDAIPQTLIVMLLFISN